MGNIKRRTSIVGIFVLAALAGLIIGQGCPPADDPTLDPTDNPTNDPTLDPTDNPTNDPTEDPTENPVEDPSGDPGLTVPQTEAVAIVTTQLEALGKALASFGDVVDPRVVTAEGGEIQIFGTCPVVTAALTEQADGVVVIFSYDGCRSTLYGGEMVAGAFTAAIIPTWDSVSVVVTDTFAIGGATVVGSGQLTRLGDTAAGSALDGQIAFTTQDVGQALGSARFAFDLDTDLITIVEADLTLKDTTEMTDTPDTNRFDAAVVDLVFSPGTEGKFVPQAGTATFDVSGQDNGGAAATLVVTFTAQSRADGTVQVSVDGGAAINYQIP